MAPSQASNTVSRGDVVHYVAPRSGQCQAALIIHVYEDDGTVRCAHEDAQTKTVALLTFAVDAEPETVLLVAPDFSEVPQPGTWHRLKQSALAVKR